MLKVRQFRVIVAKKRTLEKTLGMEETAKPDYEILFVKNTIWPLIFEQQWPVVFYEKLKANHWFNPVPGKVFFWP